MEPYKKNLAKFIKIISSNEMMKYYFERIWPQAFDYIIKKRLEEQSKEKK